MEEQGEKRVEYYQYTMPMRTQLAGYSQRLCTGFNGQPGIMIYTENTTHVSRKARLMQKETTHLPLPAEQTALLVIDVQNALFNRSRPIFQAETLLANINTLLKTFREAGGLIVFVQHQNAKMLIRNQPGWEIHPDLARVENDLVLPKTHGNAFTDTDLKEILNTRKIDTLVITGLVTHGCVRATCQGAYDLGYRLILVEDGHSNYHQDAQSLIEKWNATLSEETVELRKTTDIRLAGTYSTGETYDP